MFNGLKNLVELPFDSFKNWIGTIFTSSLISFIDGSYWILLIACLISLLFYIIGLDSSKKYISVTMLIYFLLQCLKVAMQ